VLYLYDNQIEEIKNLGFAGLLQYLYLQNNMIKEIPRLNMPNLHKLFIDDNDLSVICGLNECTNLEELTVARQRLPSKASLQFDTLTLQTLSCGLQSLDISGNDIAHLAPFTVLYNLKKMVCADNAVVDLGEVESIVALPRLEEGNFSGNPCCKFPKYRDVIIGASSNVFSILDEIAIPKHQQIAIKGLMTHRHAIGAMRRFQPNHSSSTGSFQIHEMNSHGMSSNGDDLSNED
jgi:hypothetical protein